MTTASDKVRTVFTESEVKSILARAADLEVTGRGGLVSAGDLRRIAAEAGIDPTAVDQAITESQHRPGAVSDHRADLLRMMTPKNLGLAISGVALGAMALAADGGPFGPLEPLAIFGPSAAFTAWRALRHRGRGSIGHLVRELGVLFGSFAATIAFLSGPEGFTAAVAWSFVCGLGGVAIANREDSDSRVTTTSSTG